AGRGLLIADFTIDQLAQALRRPAASLRLEAEVAPFGAVVPTLLEPRPSAFDFAVVWTRPDGILPSMARLLAAEAVSAADIGDDGWETLRLGGHDSVGEAFVEFQRALKQLTRRGILLAIASKNDEKVALEAFERHSAMVLQPDDFVAWRINWSDKAANIAD